MADWRELCTQLVDAFDLVELREAPEQWWSALGAITDALAQPEPVASVKDCLTDEELQELWWQDWDTSEECGALEFARAVIAADRAIRPASIEELGPLIAWLAEEATQAADSGRSRDAGMLTWALQVVGEQVDEDAPAPAPVGEVGRWDAELEEHLAVEWPSLTMAASPPAPVVEGEVGELVAEIRHFLAGYQQMRGLDPEHIYSIHRGDAMEAHIRVSRLSRVADLLEQLSAVQPERLRYCPTHGQQPAHVWGCPECVRDLREQLSTAAQPPQSVPVSERWPEFSDCDDADRVWCWSWAIGTWRLTKINQSIHTHWIPAHALPLPSGEVQP